VILLRSTLVDYIHYCFSASLFNISLSYSNCNSDLGIRYEGRLRLWGVNTPEIRGKEKEQGFIVREYVKELCEGQEVFLITQKWQGKYGRYVCSVWVGNDTGKGFDLADHLVERGYAKKVDY